MRITLIFNPDAGTDKQPGGEKILKLIEAAGHSVFCQPSTGDGWEEALDKPADIVAIAGGDGTVGKVSKRMIGKDASLAVLPMGTANNIARALGLSNRPFDQLIAGWSSGRRMKFDAGAASGPWGSTYFIEGLGIGLFTDTMSRLDARKNVDLAHHDAAEKKLLLVSQLMNARLESCPAYRLKVRLDDQDLSGEYVLLEALNIRYVGPNLSLAPAADPGDGLLDVVLVSKDERGQLKQFLDDRIEGKPNPSTLMVHRGRHLHIECDCYPVHIDDDVVLKNRPRTSFSSAVIDVTLEPGTLQMLVPADIRSLLN